jgi:hypothetical protein
MYCKRIPNELQLQIAAIYLQWQGPIKAKDIQDITQVVK